MKTKIDNAPELNMDDINNFIKKIEALPKPIVGITVNTETYQELKALVRPVYNKCAWCSVYGTDIYLKASQVESYKLFYDKKKLDKYLNDFEINAALYYLPSKLDNPWFLIVGLTA